MEEEATISTAAVSASAGKKRAAEDPSPSTSTSNDNNDRSTACDGNGNEDQQRCAKKPKLSKKEMLLQAKARLKEAQEKQKSALQAFEEEQKRKEQLQQQQLGEENLSAAGDDYHYNDSYYSYYYDYHIPPVTGAKETLVVTEIATTGPEEKVRFLQEKQVGIESLMRVIQSRMRGLSPTPTGGVSSTSKPKDRPASRGVSPIPPAMAATRNTSKNSAGSAPDTNGGESRSGEESATQNGQPDSNPQRPHHEGSTTTSAWGQRPTFKSTISHDDRRLPDRSLQDAAPGKRPPIKASPASPGRSASPNINNNNSRYPRRNEDESSASHNGQHNSNVRPQHETSRPLFRSNVGNDNKRLPDGTLNPPARGNPKAPLQPTGNATASHPPKPPLKPPSLPWKRALAHITGKTLDCNLDLPSNASYLIRTQDRSVLTRVRFLSAQDNATLLQQKNKSNTPNNNNNDLFHLLPLSTLPCNKSYAWKGVDILLFLQNQDQRNKKRTYQPPARRNLPLSHWAILELQHPFLPSHQPPLGNFTATLKDNTSSSKEQSSTKGDDDKKEDIHFAGKLVWNMTLTDQQHNNNKNSTNAGTKLVSSKWGEVVGAVPTSGVRNGGMVLTVQGFYEYNATTTTTHADNSGGSRAPFPGILQGRKVILPKSKTIGVIVGSNGCRPPPQSENNNSSSNNKNTTAPATVVMGTCQVLLPNGVASGPSSVQSLLGARAILYD